MGRISAEFCAAYLEVTIEVVAEDRMVDLLEEQFDVAIRITHSELVSIADSHVWSRKTYNNAISALRVAFEFGFRDHPQHHSPASMLRCVRIRKRDRVAFLLAERHIEMSNPYCTTIRTA